MDVKTRGACENSGFETMCFYMQIELISKRNFVLWLFLLFAAVYASSNETSVLSKDIAFLMADSPEKIFRNEHVDNLIWKVSPPHKAYLGMSNTPKGDNLAYHLNQVITGPGFKVSKVGDNQFEIRGCRAHSCPEKGWIWIDVAAKKTVAAVLHYMYGDSVGFPRLLVFSKDYRPSAIPNGAVRSMEVWLSAWRKEQKEFVQHFKPDFTEQDYSIGEIRFVDRAGRLSMLCEESPCTARFVLGSGKKVPDASFDCTKAGYRIERLICKDPELAEFDFKLGELYTKVLSKLNDVELFREQQRVWIHDVRDSCWDIKCLKAAYRERNDQLELMVKNQ